MSSIKYNPGNQKGKITYSADIVSGIVVASLRETQGLDLIVSKNNGIKLCFEKEGVFVDVSVIAHYGYSVPELAFRIQQNIKQMVESMTKYKIAKVDIHVQSVVFDKPTDAADAGDNGSGEEPHSDPATQDNKNDN